MKVSEMKKLLRQAGCYLVREGDNHEIWFSPITGRRFTLPRHNAHELGTGIERAIRRQAGL